MGIIFTSFLAKKNYKIIFIFIFRDFHKMTQKTSKKMTQKMTQKPTKKVAEQSDDTWSHTPKLEPVWATGAGCSCSLGQQNLLLRKCPCGTDRGGSLRPGTIWVTRKGTKKATSSGDSASRNLTTNYDAGISPVPVWHRSWRELATGNDLGHTKEARKDHEQQRHGVKELDDKL